MVIIQYNLATSKTVEIVAKISEVNLTVIDFLKH